MINFNGKAITIRSVNGAEVTTIDGTGLDDSVVKCVSGEGLDTVLEGFTVTGGTGDLSVVPQGSIGGGMYNDASSPRISNCRFTGNSTNWGGGMINYAGSSPIISWCTFANNASGNGGGLHNRDGSDPIVSNCIFFQNSAFSWGGGMFNNHSNPFVINTVFLENICTGSTGPDGTKGGGVNNFYSTNPVFINCLFSKNHADTWGGAAVNDNSSVTYINCTASLNTASENGGFLNFRSSPIFKNCIVWNNAPGQILDTDSTTVVNYSCIQGGYVGAGNISSDPLFVDASNGDFGLQMNSPCIDAGDNNSVLLDMTDLDDDGNTTEQTPFDLDNEARFLDIPAFPDTGNGVPPVVDIGVLEFGNDCNLNSVLDDLETDTDGDGIIDDCDTCPEIPLFNQTYPRADRDQDCDCDGIDFAAFASCYNKAGNPPRTAGCPPENAAAFDFFDDGDVDGVDFAAFASCYNGAGNPPRQENCPQ